MCQPAGCAERPAPRAFLHSSRRRQRLSPHDAEAGDRRSGPRRSSRRGNRARRCARCSRTGPRSCLTDLRLPQGDGFGVLRAAKELDPELPVIVMTAYGSIQDAVAAMKEGALDFLAKPVDPDHLLLMVERALAQRRLMTEYILLERGACRAARRAADHRRSSVAQAGRSSRCSARPARDATVLLEGESGTGKELFARALHALSQRADGPFVAINCAAIPDNLLETELFGHEKGAFTGAVARKPGKFELAHRGTLFLDEIGDLPLALQAKILRALEERRFERVGGTLSLQVDVRIVAATNKELRAGGCGEAVSRGSVLPPLRVSDRHSAASRPAGRHSDSGAPFRRAVQPGDEEDSCRARTVGDRRAAAISLARQRARAAELHGARGDPRGRRHHPRPPPESVAARAAAGRRRRAPGRRFDLSGTLADVVARALGEVEKRKIEQALKEAGGNKGRAADLLGLPYKSAAAETAGPRTRIGALALLSKLFL